jgi:hypothetical protein
MEKQSEIATSIALIAIEILNLRTDLSRQNSLQFELTGKLIVVVSAVSLLILILKIIAVFYSFSII